MEYEVASCAFLKEVVQGNRLMKRVKDAAEGKRSEYLSRNADYNGLKQRNNFFIVIKFLLFSILRCRKA